MGRPLDNLLMVLQMSFKMMKDYLGRANVKADLLGAQIRAIRLT